jgi:hypothetical protein
MDDVPNDTGGEKDRVKYRKIRHDLRGILESACRISEPCFDTKQGWGGSPQSMYARQALRETYPQLTQQEIAILFSVVQRFHRIAAKGH